MDQDDPARQLTEALKALRSNQASSTIITRDNIPALVLALLLGIVLAGQVLLYTEIQDAQAERAAMRVDFDKALAPIQRETRLTTAYLQDYENQRSLRED